MTTTNPQAGAGDGADNPADRGGQVLHDTLATLDFVWEQLASRLDGLTDAEYLWEPAEESWNARPTGTGSGARPY
jgi:hypothetical protein